MKQYLSIITLAAISLLAASGCRKDDLQVKDDTGDLISFAVNQSNYWNNNAAGSQTKAGGDLTLFSADGDTLHLSLSISDNMKSDALPAQINETKGELITGSTLGKYQIDLIAFMHGTGDLFMVDQIKYMNNDHAYAPEGASSAGHWATIDSHTYYWPKATALDFWAWAPHDAIQSAISATTDATVKISFAEGVSSFVTSGNGPISFNYDLGEGTNATATPDLMFATVADVTKSKAKELNVSGCVPLEFKHALSAIKFMVTSTKSAKVNYIKLVDVVKTGTCKYPGDSDSFKWDKNEWSEDNTSFYSFTLGDEGKDLGYNEANKDYESGDYYATSAFPTAHFMMIPQALGKGQMIEISITYNGKTEPTIFTGSIPEGSWEAGKVYTYVISITELDIELREDFTDTTVKKDVKVENTGGRNAYVRMAVIANWVDASGNIVRSCDWMDTGTIEGKNWGEDKKWILHSDGWFYYKNGISPHKFTESLFSKYMPATEPYLGLTMSMKVLTQGVEFDASNTNAEEAWGTSIKAILSKTIEK